MLADSHSLVHVDISVPAALAGLGFGLSLIVAIGPQNAFVLRTGLRREHVAIVVAICALSDIALIVAGVAGMGALLRREPVLLTVVRVVGATFLLGYAALALYRAIRSGALGADNHLASTLRAAVLTALALTWLNPGVYLDTVLLLGSVANTHPGQQWVFAAGAAIGSVGWFLGLGFGARVLGPAFTRPIAWRLLDIAVAIVMTSIGLRLALNGTGAPPVHPGS
jgi:L-lysine exporter family protein LysE/ArgO